MNIHIQAPIGFTGYGNASINILKELNKDNDVCLTSIGAPQVENKQDAEIVSLCMDKQKTVRYDAITIKIWHQFDLLNRVGSGKYYAYPFFEIDYFNELEKHHLNFPDTIIASSQWAKQILENNNLNKPIKIVPLGVDLEIFHPVENQQKLDNFVFITIGKWEIRKSHDIVIECFNKAFSIKDNVELWMVTHNPFLNKDQENEWLNIVQKSKMKEKIKIFPRLPSQKDLAQVISYANCGIYVSRAEGWNLELLETMSMNKPVIATNFSAHTEFCNKDNSYLVDIKQIEKAVDNKWFNGQGNWAKIGDVQKDQIIEYMRYVYNNNIQENNNGVITGQKFTWKNSAKELLRCIED
jgi:glycosyltransferase involved in cell wall biosynthesis